MQQQIVAWLQNPPRPAPSDSGGVRPPPIQKGTRTASISPYWFRSGSPLSGTVAPRLECKRPDKFTLADLQVQVNRYLPRRASPI